MLVLPLRSYGLAVLLVHGKYWMVPTSTHQGEGAVPRAA